MKRKWLVLPVALVLVVALLLPACAKEEVAPTVENTLTIAVDSLGQDNFDPLTVGIQNKRYLTLLFDSLVGHIIEGQLSEETGIAYKWEMTPDGKTWTFYLREGIRFHNGDELTAEDVKFHLDRVFDPASGSTQVPALRTAIDSVEAVDPYKVVVRLNAPSIFLPEMLSELTGTEGMICSKRYIEEEGIDYLATHPMGTGPFKMKEFV